MFLDPQVTIEDRIRQKKGDVAEITADDASVGATRDNSPLHTARRPQSGRSSVAYFDARGDTHRGARRVDEALEPVVEVPVAVQASQLIASVAGRKVGISLPSLFCLPPWCCRRVSWSFLGCPRDIGGDVGGDVGVRGTCRLLMANLFAGWDGGGGD